MSHNNEITTVLCAGFSSRLCSKDFESAEIFTKFSVISDYLICLATKPAAQNSYYAFYLRQVLIDAANKI